MTNQQLFGQHAVDPALRTDQRITPRPRPSRGLPDSEHHGLRRGLPPQERRAVTAERKEQASILVAINDAGQIWIDKRVVDVRAVRANIERLRAENPQGGLVIQADKNSRNGLLVEVMDAARQAGVENVSIAAVGRE